MGTSRRRNPKTGNWVLDCAECGIANGTVRKRYCPSEYCYPAQLCPVCYALERQNGKWAGHHADCARLHRECNEREAGKNLEPARWARSAFGDWSPFVPAGMVGVITRAGNGVLIAKVDYRPDEPLPDGLPDWPHGDANHWTPAA
jgi:hypothetical protein